MPLPCHLMHSWTGVGRPDDVVVRADREVLLECPQILSAHQVGFCR